MREKWRSLEYKTKIGIVAAIALFVFVSMVWG
jgi:hypothetical protein